METLTTEHLCKTMEGVLTLGPLDLHVAPGEIVGIIGPPESGKTTLLRLLWGFLRPDEGRITVFGMQPHLHQVTVRLRAGYVANCPRFCTSLTAKQHLRFVGSFYGGWDESVTDRLLEQFGVDADVGILELSQADRMKVSLISALGHRPSLLLLDEPTSGLDPVTRAEILQFLRRAAWKHKTSILLSAHLSDDLDQIADSILVLNRGRVVEYARCPSQFA
jgi:ABC-2 type transport system ATP-binding protein